MRLSSMGEDTKEKGPKTKYENMEWSTCDNVPS